MTIPPPPLSFPIQAWLHVLYTIFLKGSTIQATHMEPCTMYNFKSILKSFCNAWLAYCILTTATEAHVQDKIWDLLPNQTLTKPCYGCDGKLHFRKFSFCASKSGPGRETALLRYVFISSTNTPNLPHGSLGNYLMSWIRCVKLGGMLNSALLWPSSLANCAFANKINNRT